MPVTDVIADFLTRIRNAGRARHNEVLVPFSKMKWAICQILKDQGYIEDFEKLDDNVQGTIRIKLKYYNRQPVIREIKRVSKPGRRIYVGAKEIPRVKNGLGIAVVSTSRGIMTDKMARKLNIGGELLFTIW
ncbi:30S ribosomal protein S8 [Bacteroidetes/Chlorobi group bacterium MS-B_bin-24]|jgi:small subunit ribosomal protein S8|nr:MAG: 30S ribosomal protein S8 [Bacteroidetes/Chlorobi group bacterium MS-B_bin-24]